jgi:hypothetical protein
MDDTLYHTKLFLQSLSNCGDGRGSNEVALMANGLVEVLKTDGFILQQLDATSMARNLRGLAESSGGGGVDVFAVIAVIACIVCAGLASGLTQARRVTFAFHCISLTV